MGLSSVRQFTGFYCCITPDTLLAGIIIYKVRFVVCGTDLDYLQGPQVWSRGGFEFYESRSLSDEPRIERTTVCAMTCKFSSTNFALIVRYIFHDHFKTGIHTDLSYSHLKYINKHWGKSSFLNHTDKHIKMKGFCANLNDLNKSFVYVI